MATLSDTIVSLDVHVDPTALDETGRDLLATFHTQYDAVQAAREALHEVPTLKADEDRKVAEAARKGTPAPRTNGPAYYDELSRVRRQALLDQSRRALAAAETFEAHVLADPEVCGRLATILTAAHAEEVDLVARASAVSARRRALASTIRDLAVRQARANGKDEAASEEAATYVSNYYSALSRREPSAVSEAWTTVGNSAASFEALAYGVSFGAATAAAAKDLAARATALGMGSTATLAEVQRREALVARNGGVVVETDEQRRLRALAREVPSPAPARPFVKTAGHLSAEEVQAAAQARRADVALASALSKPEVDDPSDD
jgi:hypothetical protein